MPRWCPPNWTSKALVSDGSPKKAMEYWPSESSVLLLFAARYSSPPMMLVTVSYASSLRSASSTAIAAVCCSSVRSVRFRPARSTNVTGKFDHEVVFVSSS